MPDLVNPYPYVPNSYYNSGQLVVDSATAQMVSNAVQGDAQSLPPVEQAAFLGLVKGSTTLAPGADGAPPADLNATLTRYEHAAAAITGFLAMAQNPEELAAIIIEASYSEEENATQEIVDNALQEMYAAYAAANQDKQGAATLMTDAIIGLALNLAGSLLEIGGGAYGAYGAGKAANELNDLSSEGGAEVTDNIEIDDPSASPGGPTRNTDGDDDDSVDGVDGTSNADQPPNANLPAAGADSGDDDDEIEIPGSSDNDKNKGQVDGKNKSDRELALEGIRARHDRYRNIAQVFNGVGGLGKAAGQFADTDGSSQNQMDQANGQEDTAQENWYREQGQTYTQFLSQTQNFVDQMQQGLSGIEGAETSMGQAVSNSRANI